MPSTFHAIVPAAGTGARFGACQPKQYLDLLGVPLIRHTLDVLCACERMHGVTVVLAPDDPFWADHDWSAISARLNVLRQGGETRAGSVRNGLEALLRAGAGENDWVLVHDAARPCLSPGHLQTLMQTLEDDPVGGLLAVPVADTLKRADSQSRVADTVPREDLWQAQTPQMFRLGVLREALQSFPAVTDEASAIEAIGLKPRLVAGDTANLKVTYPADLVLAAAILRAREQASE